jgi:hypothetical protein
MENQFTYDVTTMGKELTKIIEQNFDLTNPWDQSVMVAILANLLAYVEVQAEIDDCNMEQTMKYFYESYLEDYRQQAFKGKKVKR